jgi:hypothetical protein
LARPEVGGCAFLAEQRAAGIIPSTIFSTPGFQVKHIIVGYMRAMDLGVAADWLGNLFLLRKELCSSKEIILVVTPNHHCLVQVLSRRSSHRFLFILTDEGCEPVK